jgi:hypothetical protein
MPFEDGSLRGMKWLDPMPTDCPSCGGRFAVPVAALRSLGAACPRYGSSLAAIGEWMLLEEARFRREVDPFLVAFELNEQGGLGSGDGVVGTRRR